MFAALIRHMTEAACKGDGAAVAGCFTTDGVYHDVFYGSFRGDGIAEMIEKYFHRDGKNFRWDIHDPVESTSEDFQRYSIGYARYVFSYTSRMEAYKGRRAIFEGVAVCRLRDGLIDDYREVANATTGLSMLGFTDDRIARFVDRQATELAARPEAAGHKAPQ